MMTGHRTAKTIQLYDHSREAYEEGAANFFDYDPEKDVGSAVESPLHKPESKNMFARWKKRRLKRSEANGDAAGVVRYAVLVRSMRIKGRPRQKVVRYL